MFALITTAFLIFSILITVRGNRAYADWAMGYQKKQLSIFSDIVSTLRAGKTIHIFHAENNENKRFVRSSESLTQLYIKGTLQDFVFFFAGMDGLKIIYQIFRAYPEINDERE